METLVNIAISVLMIGCVICSFLLPVAVYVDNSNLFGGTIAYLGISFPFMLILLAVKENID